MVNKYWPNTTKCNFGNSHQRYSGGQSEADSEILKLSSKKYNQPRYGHVP